MSKPPVITPELLKWLEGLFPDRVPRGDLELAEFARAQGEQIVLDKLRYQFKQQQKDILSA